MQTRVVIGQRGATHLHRVDTTEWRRQLQCGDTEIARHFRTQGQVNLELDVLRLPSIAVEIAEGDT